MMMKNYGDDDEDEDDEYDDDDEDDDFETLPLYMADDKYC